MSSKESVLGCPGVSHEESVLEHYFPLLSQSNFDKAKELVDSEKDGHKFSAAASWGETLQCLSQLATAEKSYSSLLFLAQKRFPQIGRSKDSAKSIYAMLQQEFQRMETFLMQPVERGSSHNTETDKLLAHISGQLSFFVRGRLKMIEFFELLCTLGGLKQWMNFEDLVMNLEEILKDHMKGFHHPLIASLKSVFCLECESLCHLLNAQVKMTCLSYLPAVLELYQAHTKLNTWGAMIPVKEVKSTFGRSSNKTNIYPPLFTWMLKLRSHLLSKYGLYFYDTLSKQTIPSEIKATLSRVPDDFVSRVQAFQKKFDATNVHFILDASNLPNNVGHASYYHPNKYCEPPVGIENFPPIFSYPAERVINPIHWPSIIMLIEQISDCVDKVHFSMEKEPSQQHPQKPQSYYFITQVEARIYMVVIFENRKSEKDSSIMSYMTDLTSLLRFQNIFSSLRMFARS